MNPSTPPLNVRALLLDALSSTDPDDELEALDEVFAGAALWTHAVAYFPQRRSTLAAIRSGFDKSWDRVIAMVEGLRARAPGPKEPDVYQVKDTEAWAWVWRTGTGRTARLADPLRTR